MNKCRPSSTEQCDKEALFVHMIDGKPKWFCKEHYHNELEITYELWAEKHGSFCMECGEDITVELLNNPKLDCYCEDHRK